MVSRITCKLHRVYIQTLLMCGLLVCGSTSLAEEAETTSVLQLTGPEHLFAGQAEGAELQLLSTDANLATEAPTILVSSGKVGPPRRVGDGHWSFTYQLPDEKYPQIILVVAYQRSSQRLAVLRLPLFGKPVVVVQSEPGVSLEVRDGEQRFGPVQTDARGRAEVRIVVPPGRSSVATFAKDSFGNVTEAQLPLNLPAFPSFLPVCINDGQSVYVIGAAEPGTADSAGSSEVVVSAPGLEVGAAVSVSPGVEHFALKATQPVTSATTVSVRVASGKEVRHCSLQLVPLPRVPAPRLQGTVVPIEPKVGFLLGPMLGATSNLGKLNGLWGGLRAAYPFSQTRLGLRIEAEASYTHSVGSGQTETQEELALSVDALPLALGLRYVLGFGGWEPSIALSAGATGAIAHVSGARSTSTALAVQPLVGGSLSLGRRLDAFTLYGEAGYWYSRLNAGGLAGNVQGLRLGAGATFEL